MASFQMTIIYIAVILLVIFLIFIGISLYRNKKNLQYPPVSANCPDYWLDESNAPKNLIFQHLFGLVTKVCV